ncbi:MAG TPA: hypothetical protein VHX43_12605 [Xanthobacteraceae bacterium]|jgi:hypothetical protein|nr:hypothetical protein [Xanthobacteraceae bacterium]
MPTALRHSADWRPVFFIAVLLLFVAGIPYLGFDLAIFFFVIAALWLFGERRVLFSLSLALGIAVLCVGCVLGCALGLQAIG